MKAWARKVMERKSSIVMEETWIMNVLEVEAEKVGLELTDDELNDLIDYLMDEVL